MSYQPWNAGAVPRRAAVPLDALDHVIAIEPRSIRTVKHVRADEPYFAGHYPSNPIYPGIYTVEAVIQAVRAHLAWGRRDGWLAEVVSTRFLAPVQPGDTLTVHCELALGEPGGELLVKAECSKEETQVAEVKLKFRLEEGHA